MKTILLTVTFILTTFLLTAQSKTEIATEGTSITVTVPIKSTTGKVIFGLHNESTFMKEALVGLSSDIKDGLAKVTFTNVTPGTYGIVVLHDKNDNKRMDFEPSGMPKEAFGVSNNVMVMGPPQWNDAKFEVADTPIEMEIRL
jgi:uncharacterized protein (DUF2141 family)